MKVKGDKPMRERCDCGNAVKNHHWLCDKCWGKKSKKEYMNERKGINKILRNARRKGKKKLKQLNKTSQFK